MNASHDTSRSAKRSSGSSTVSSVGVTAGRGVVAVMAISLPPASDAAEAVDDDLGTGAVTLRRRPVNVGGAAS